MGQFALSSLVGAASGGTFTVLLAASSPALLAGVDAPRELASAPLAPLDGTLITDVSAATLLEGGALPAGGARRAAGGAPVGPGTVATVVHACGEPLALAADLWAFHAATSPSPAAALSRGVPAPSGAAWHVPLDFSARAGAATPPTGIALAVVASQWSLTGAPVAELYASGGALAGAAPGAGGPHVVVLDGGAAGATLAATVPAGALRPGYVYRPAVTFTLRASWSAASGVAPWDVGGVRAVPGALTGVKFDMGASETLTVASAYAPLLYVHAPPLGGTVSVAPASGTAFLTPFSVGSGGWASPDATALRAAPPAPASPAAAAALALAYGGAAAAAAGSPCSGGGGALVALLAARLAATGAPPAGAAFCGAAAAGRRAAAAAAAASAPPPSALLFGFFVADDGPTVSGAALGSSWPLGLAADRAGAPLSAAGVGALVRSQAALKVGTASVPGTALASGRASSTLPPQPLSPLGAAAAASTASTPLLFSSTATDAYGAVGVAFGFATLTPVAAAAPPPSAGADATAAFVASSLGGGGAPAPPPTSPASAALVVSAAATAASLMSSAAGGGASNSAAVTSVQTAVLANVAAALPALAGADAATTAAAASTALAALSSLTASASTSAVAAGGAPPASAAAAATANSLAAAAVSGVASLLALYKNASVGGALGTGAPQTGAILGVLGNALTVAASTSTGGTGEATNAVTGLPAGGNTLPMSTGGVAPALRANVTSALVAVASGLLTGVPPGGSASTSSAPADATDRTPPVASYCGPAFSMTAARVGAGAAARANGVEMAITPPLNPCFPTASSAGAVSLPPALVAAQPPPSTSLSPALLNALAAAAGGGAFDVNMVQWGVSPNPETALLSTRYPALPAMSDVALNATSAAAPQQRRGLASLFGGLLGLVNALGGRSAPQASAGALTAVSPRAVTDDDLLPNRPMDSRTVSVNVVPAGSTRRLSGLTTPTPFTLVIPLRDLSIVDYKPGGGSTVNVGQGAFGAPVINVTCPLSPAAAAAGVAAFALRADGTRGERVKVTLVKTQEVGFMGVVGAEVEAASLDGAGAGLADGGTSATTDTLAGGGAPPTVASAEFTYILSTDCGKAFGPRTFVCGPGAGGSVLQYACPVATPVPTCFWFNEAKGKWSMEGTTVVARDLTSVTCSTTRVADHAVRFSTLPQVMPDVFSTQAPLTRVSRFGFSAAFYACVGVITAFFAVGAFSYGRAAAEARWAAALSAQPEVAALRRAADAEGAPFALTLAAARGGASAKVAPGAESDDEGAGGKRGAAAGRRALPPLASAKVLPVGGASSADALHNALSEAVGDLLAPHRSVGRYAAQPFEATPGFSASPRRGTARGGAPPPPPSLDALLAEYRAPTTTAGVSASTRALLSREPPGTVLRALLFARLRAAPHALCAAPWPLLCCAPCGRRAPVYYHPALPAALPAPTRFVFSLCAAVFGLAGVCVFYSALLGGQAAPGKQQLVPLSGAQFVALAAAAAAFISAPLDALLSAALRALAGKRAAWASPALARERARRAAAAALLTPLPTSALLTLLGRPLPTYEDAEELDEDAPPGWVSPPDWLLSLAPGVATRFGRHPEQKVAAAAAAAAAAAGALDASALREAFAAATRSAGGTAPPSALASPTTAATLLAAAAFAVAFAYVDTWMRTRGVSAGSLACAAWALAWFINLAILAPAAAAARLAAAPLIREATAWLPAAAAAAEFSRWEAVDAWAAAAAAGAAAGVPEADAAAALLEPGLLAAAVAHAAGGARSAEARARRLRVAALSAAYHFLLEEGAAAGAAAEGEARDAAAGAAAAKLPPPRASPGSGFPREDGAFAASSREGGPPRSLSSRASNPEPLGSGSGASPARWAPGDGGDGDALSNHVAAAAASPRRARPAAPLSPSLPPAARAGGSWGTADALPVSPGVAAAFRASRGAPPPPLAGADFPAAPMQGSLAIIAANRAQWRAHAISASTRGLAPAPGALLGAGVAAVGLQRTRGLNLATRPQGGNP